MTDPVAVALAESELETSAHAYAGAFSRWLKDPALLSDPGVATAEAPEVVERRQQLYAAALGYALSQGWRSPDDDTTPSDRPKP